MKSRALVAAAAACVLFANAAIGQSDYVLMLEQGDRKFEFAESVTCIERTRGGYTRLLADRFLLVRIDDGDVDKYFVNSMPESCPGLSGSRFSGGFADDHGDELSSDEICAGDWYVRSAQSEEPRRPVPGIDCELGTFWKLSVDFGAALAAGRPQLFDSERPARFAVVAAEEFGLRPELLTADQALVSWARFPPEDYESCASECSALGSLPVPGCLQQAHVRDRLFETRDELYDSMPRVRLPRRACGCGTFVLTENGGMNDIDMRFSSPPDAGERIKNALSGLSPIGPLPSEASCLIGMTVPFTFIEP